jgi:hypothetical protein
MIRELRTNELEKFTDLAVQHAIDAGLISHDQLERNYVKQQCKQVMISPDYKILVVVKDDVFVGYVVGNITQKLWNSSLFGEVIMFFIHPDVRNKYLADDLFQAIQDWFIDNGCIYFQASCMNYTQDYKANDDYLRRSRIYFQKQHMNEVGYHFVKQLERN